jgi:hypothetical protein
LCKAKKTTENVKKGSYSRAAVGVGYPTRYMGWLWVKNSKKTAQKADFF